MNKFVFLSLIFMGWAFFELSGGTDFVPRKAELIAAAEAERAAEAEKRSQRVAVRAAPAEPVITDPVITQVSLSTPVTPAPDPEVIPVLDRAAQPGLTSPALRADAEEPPQTTLVSLEQSGTLFARPLAQLEEGVPTATLEQAVIPVDIREVAGTRVNMRNGPGTGFGVLTSLPRGTAVEIIDSDGTGWVKLRTMDDQTVGWMAERLLTAPTG